MPPPEPYYVERDDDHSPEAADELAGLRGQMLANVMHSEIPWLAVVPCTDKPAIEVTNLANGRSTIVGLFAAGAFMTAINELFGD